jgi:MFS family permease
VVSSPRPVPSPARRAAATAATASLGLAVAMLPMFLFGALSATIGAELGFDEARTGVALTAFFLAAAVTAVPIGRLTERIGARRAIRTGVAISALASLTVGTVASTWWQVAIALAVGGGILPFVDTGGARAFTTSISVRRRGLAFGVKEASVPFASMLAGLAVPLLATTIGWRAAFLAAAAIGPVAWVALRVIRDEGRGATGPVGSAAAAAPASVTACASASGTAASRRLPPAIRWYAIGFALAGGASATATAFLVPSATAAGMTPAAAGTTLAVASVSSIAARLLAGWGADRFLSLASRGLLVLIGLGALGALLLAAGPPGAVIVVAAFLLLAGGAGWTGLGFTAVVRAAPSLPASASALVLTGLAVGGTVGPLLFGVVVSGVGYGVGWLVIAIAFGSGATVVGVASRRAASPATARGPSRR